MMNLTQCREAISKTGNLIGRQVLYNEKKYIINKVFPAPADGKVKIFLVDYYLNNRDEKVALNKFLSSKHLDVFIMCNPFEDNQQDVLLKLSEVELLDS
ncbi:hypothetical protein [Pedobacter sp. ASV28]|uniref:hypothetical protein n=1 Tax=Pedobacter sp. ASV28 TaxID=2795123 RepID=UPI0018ED1549|nr:hypothetical protein [Pedobacter sp. ASV28]